MTRRCPTCGGAGKVVAQWWLQRGLEGIPMFWGGPIPTETCLGCAGSGWVTCGAPCEPLPAMPKREQGQSTNAEISWFVAQTTTTTWTG